MAPHSRLESDSRPLLQRSITGVCDWSTYSTSKGAKATRAFARCPLENTLNPTTFNLPARTDPSMGFRGSPVRIRPSRLVESEARRGESVVGTLSLVGQARKWHEFFGMSSFEAWLQSQGLQGAESGQGSGGCFPKTPSAQILRT